MRARTAVNWLWLPATLAITIAAVGPGNVANILGAERYSQHAVCLTNDTLMIWLYTVAGLISGASYLAIAGAMYHAREIHVRLSGPTWALFYLFICLCGLQHLSEVLTLYTGVYRLDVLMKVATAAVSASAALTTTRDVLGLNRARTDK